MSSPATRDYAASAYLEQDVTTADPVTLIAHVFDAAHSHVVRARSALAARQLAAKGRAVERASRCLDLLQTSLDLERGGEVAKNFDRLYAYLLRRLGEGHRRNDEAAFAEIASYLAGLGTAWREAAVRQRTSATAASATASPTNLSTGAR
jgi:flagellar secretion chaperone FliS